MISLRQTELIFRIQAYWSTGNTTQTYPCLTGLNWAVFYVPANTV